MKNKNASHNRKMIGKKVLIQSSQDRVRTGIVKNVLDEQTFEILDVENNEVYEASIFDIRSV